MKNITNLKQLEIMDNPHRSTPAFALGPYKHRADPAEIKQKISSSGLAALGVVLNGACSESVDRLARAEGHNQLQRGWKAHRKKFTYWVA